MKKIIIILTLLTLSSSFVYIAYSEDATEPKLMEAAEPEWVE